MPIQDAIIAVDFDGTLVTNGYPEIGMDAGGVPVVKELMANGYRVILFTMRSGHLLKRAVEWCEKRGLKFYAVNENPEQRGWTSSPKVYANLYIDDSGLGCPIKFIDGIPRPVADWVKIREQLVQDGYLD